MAEDLKKEFANLDALNLAFLGDAVYELMVRRDLVEENTRVGDLHKKAVHYVSANAQCADFKNIEDLLTEDELDLVKRARNKSQHNPKNTKIQVYRMATGFEALIGALYLSGAEARLEFLYGKIKRRREWK